MASKPPDIAKMILKYEWILENVDEEAKTIIASKMILFRGERVFRVGLKNHHVESPVLFLMAVDLNKIGMKVEEVMYGIQDSSSGNSPPTMSQMEKNNIGDKDNLQLFTIKLAELVTGNKTFVFRICIEGSVPGYSYQLSDRLVKEQLWAGATSKNLVDVEFVVNKDNKFSAHKVILAARSKVFAAEFTKEQPVGSRPDKETEIFFDRTTPTFRCAFSFDKSESERSKCIMKYQNEQIFFAYITGKLELHGNHHYHVHQPVIHWSCAQHRKFGLQLEDIYVKHAGCNKWLKMKSKILQKNAELLHFTTHPQYVVNQDSEFYFDVKMMATIGSYYYDMMDDAWIKDFWFAATNKKLTDVEIFVGTVKVMEAHRIILSARSPVMNAELFKKIGNTRKSVIAFNRNEFEVDIVKHFLKFLYTGSLEASVCKSANYKQLLKLATTYKVETLKNICQLANRVPDVEELTNSLLEL